MTSTDSFGAKGTIAAGGSRVRDLPALRRRGLGAPAVQPQGAPGEPAAHRGRGQRHGRPRARARRVGPERRARHRDPVHPGARDHAGLHGRAVRRRPRHDARGRHRARRRPGQGQPAGPGRARHRPFGDHRRVRHGRRVRAQRRLRVRPQQGALPVPALGPGRVRRVQGRAAGHRHRAPGQHRAPGPRRHDAGTARPTRTRSSAPTRTPPWSTASACWAGASAASRPRPRCSASRCRCSSRGWSASSSPARSPRAPRPPTSC